MYIVSYQKNKASIIKIKSQDEIHLDACKTKKSAIEKELELVLDRIYYCSHNLSKYFNTKTPVEKNKIMRDLIKHLQMILTLIDKN